MKMGYEDDYYFCQEDEKKFLRIVQDQLVGCLQMLKNLAFLEVG